MQSRFGKHYFIKKDQPSPKGHTHAPMATRGPRPKSDPDAASGFLPRRPEEHDLQLKDLLGALSLIQQFQVQTPKAPAPETSTPAASDPEIPETSEARSAETPIPEHTRLDKNYPDNLGLHWLPIREHQLKRPHPEGQNRPVRDPEGRGPNRIKKYFMVILPAVLTLTAALGILTLTTLGLTLTPTDARAQTMSTFIPNDPMMDDEDIDAQVEQIILRQQLQQEKLNPDIDRQIPGAVISDIGTSPYTLGANDLIEISVMRHPEVSGKFMVNNEGKIQYEFVGDIDVAGLNKDEVKDKLTQALSEYIISPEVTVKIVGYNSKVVYVVGEVNRPGKIYMRGDTITVREALIQAGLPLLTAKAAKSRLITPSEGGKAKIVNVNVNNLLYEGDLSENLVMKPGDTLFIPATFLAKTMRVLQPVAQPIGTVSGTGRTIMTGF